MSIPMSHIDGLINAAIDKLSCDGGFVHQFYIDLRTYQQRITQQLIERCIDACQARGLYVEQIGDGLSVTVDLKTCVMNQIQAQNFSLALGYSRSC
ncbi:hypothetical protein [Aeromonas sobria]|jgi:hypothetical protein|uniref:hypothetical protein n=1 Tax=Aeromonas sobria TaxID=646 RepID=UPI00111783DF|nr:hypothetical protein [Aeromonas sobria]TNH79289.1 hypothetical protein CF140_20040 [Aeromonas sobria]